MKLSEKVKPPVEDQVPLIPVIDVEARTFEGEEPDDDTDDDEAQLMAAVDYLRRANNHLAYFYTVNAETEFMGGKAHKQLGDLVEEIEDFLGEYR